jgi:hypothetical protein
VRKTTTVFLASLMACAVFAACGQDDQPPAPEPALSDPGIKPVALIKAKRPSETALGVYAWEIRGSHTANLVIGIDRNGGIVLSLLSEIEDADTQKGRLTFTGAQPFTYVMNRKAQQFTAQDNRYDQFFETYNLYLDDYRSHDVLAEYDVAGVKCLTCGLTDVSCSGNAAGCVASSGTGPGCIQRTVTACGGAVGACGLCVKELPLPPPAVAPDLVPQMPPTVPRPAPPPPFSPPPKVAD